MLNGVAEMVSDARIQRRGRGRRPERGKASWSYCFELGFSGWGRSGWEEAKSK